MSGGAPFTKDIVYLFGLMQVGNLIRATFASGRSDVLRLLFCGKLDLLDVPVLCQLHAMDGYARRCTSRPGLRIRGICWPC
jgi:hypothetical protein